ncbi:MAG: sigma-70 family RNA polymerase sigma factor [Desulfobacterales bacterium]
MHDDPVTTAYENAKRKWPGLPPDCDRLRERVSAAGKEPEKMPVEDLFLAISIEDGNPLALEIFFREYGPYIRNLCMKVVKNPDTADDILQQFVSELPRRISKYKGTGTLYGWLAFVIRNYSIDWLRKDRYAKYQDEISPEIAAPACASDADIHPDIEKCRGFFHQIFSEAMKKLKPDWQLLIRCSFFDGLTNREIAQTVLKTPEYNISKWMKKALAQVKKGMETSVRTFGTSGRETLNHCFEVLTDYPDYFDLSGIFRQM